MRIRTEAKIYDDVNLTPLMDLAWNLLIVFVIMATATVQGISVDLPKASASPSLSKASTRAVTVTADGRLYLDTQLVSIEQLEEKLRREKSIRPDLPVVVKGDARVQYDKVIQVLDVMKRLQIVRLGLVTQRLVK
jgi:biopolymer transport protein ExbD